MTAALRRQEPLPMGTHKRRSPGWKPTRAEVLGLERLVMLQCMLIEDLKAQLRQDRPAHSGRQGRTA